MLLILFAPIIRCLCRNLQTRPAGLRLVEIFPQKFSMSLQKPAPALRASLGAISKCDNIAKHPSGSLALDWFKCQRTLRQKTIAGPYFQSLGHVAGRGCGLFGCIGAVSAAGISNCLEMPAQVCQFQPKSRSDRRKHAAAKQTTPPTRHMRKPAQDGYALVVPRLSLSRPRLCLTRIKFDLIIGSNPYV